MKRIFGSENFSHNERRPIVAMGVFDGVHLGHSHLIESALEEAKKSGGRGVVYTFEPHPVKILAPAECPPLLQTLEQKLDAIEALGADACVIEPFTAELAHSTAADFFKSVIVDKLHAHAVVVGYDFTFGLHREGTVEMLEKLGAGHGVRIIVVGAQFLGETLISSTNIRRLLEHGNVKEAAALLGHPYMIEGKVVPGAGLGRRLLAHTANIESENELLPKDGVYLSTTIVSREKGAEETKYPSVTSIGDNPTFPGPRFTVETHLIDEAVDIVGWRIAVWFLDRMRDQIAFDTEDELRGQIRRDIEAAREMHASQRMSL